MWAQIVKSRSKPGRAEDIRQLPQYFEAQGVDRDLAPARIMLFQNQNDPEEFYTLALFDSEEQARNHEVGPEQQERLKRLEELFERGPGTPEYIDLVPVFDWSR